MDKQAALFGKIFKNPVLAASGCFGFGREAAAYMDLSQWGGLVSKGLTPLPRIGNPAPRICETPSGMLNSVGLQNPGIEAFIERELPFMLEQGTEIIVNVAGNSTEDYAAMCARLRGKGLTAIELNLSCPNVAHGCMSIGTDPYLLSETVKAAKKEADVPLIAKLTPNVTDIALCAQAAEEGGADAVSLVNTFLGMAVDLRTRRPILKNNTGGLSGPAIKPLALRMCSDVCRAVRIPVIGMGGISSGRDVLEFILTGVSLVQVGLANFYHPYTIEKIIMEMDELGEELKINSLDEIRGKLELWAK